MVESKPPVSKVFAPDHCVGTTASSSYGSSMHNKRRLGHNEVREVSRAGRGKVCQAQALEFYAEYDQDSLKAYQESGTLGFSLANPITRTRLLVMNPKSMRCQLKAPSPGKELCCGRSVT